MITVNEYRLFCINSPTNEKYVWDDDEPTKCPTDPINHVIDQSKTTITRTVSENEIVVKEEDVKTGGYFMCRAVRIDAQPNTTTSYNFTTPFQTTALKVNFNTTSENYLDEICMSVNKNTVIGVLTTNINPATTYENKNYLVGDKVIFNSFVYTCIKQTENNEPPTNSVYWINGYELQLTSTVMKYPQIGFFIKIGDVDMGRIILKNVVTNTIYVENNTPSQLIQGTPIKMTMFVIKDFIISNPNTYDIGDCKIGGSSVAKNYVISVDYKNNGNTLKTFIGYVHYLY